LDLGLEGPSARRSSTGVVTEHDPSFVSGPGKNLRIVGPGKPDIEGTYRIECRDPPDDAREDFLVEVLVDSEGEHEGGASGPVAERS
jgi:hypothetical protein